MPDRRKHRGPHPDDAALFTSDAHPRLRQATADLSWLLSRGYASASALKLVGDRYQLAARQRLAVGRAACSDQARESRRERRRDLADAGGQTLLIDGYNLLTTIEAALAGGVILHARDGCYRDLASVHGTFRKVRETAPAIDLVGRFLAELAPQRCTWYLDSPVSNSGRLKTTLRETAERAGWPWNVELVFNPDRVLAASPEPVVTTDSVILDRCASWLNLAAALIASRIPRAWLIDLSG